MKSKDSEKKPEGIVSRSMFKRLMAQAPGKIEDEYFKMKKKVEVAEAALGEILLCLDTVNREVEASFKRVNQLLEENHVR